MPTLDISSGFVAVDVETASADPASICQLGIAFFAQGSLRGVKTYLVRPSCAFAPSHTACHGITQTDVDCAPSWDEVYRMVRPSLTGNVIVSHTFFDRTSMFQACCGGRAPMFSYVRWIDSCRAARRAWPGLDGYSLGFLARQFGIPHRPHDAGDDARVAGEIYLRALNSLATRSSS